MKFWELYIFVQVWLFFLGVSELLDIVESHGIFDDGALLELYTFL